MDMSTKSAVSIAEYLRTSFEDLDWEYVDEYSAWGIPHIWLVDPAQRRLQVYSAGTLSEVSTLEIPEYDARLTSAQIFG